MNHDLLNWLRAIWGMPPLPDDYAANFLTEEEWKALKWDDIERCPYPMFSKEAAEWGEKNDARLKRIAQERLRHG